MDSIESLGSSSSSLVQSPYRIPRSFRFGSSISADQGSDIPALLNLILSRTARVVSFCINNWRTKRQGEKNKFPSFLNPFSRFQSKRTPLFFYSSFKARLFWREMDGKWGLLLSFAVVVFALAAVAAELEDLEPAEVLEFQYFKKVLNFLWVPDETSYHHVWPVNFSCQN